MLDDTVKKETQPQPEAQIVAIYLRNVSLETASSPLLLREGIKPEIKLELRVQINSLKDEQEEVVLDLSITARDGSSLLYLLKLQQAGTVTLKHFEDDQKAFFLNTACPQMLFPYVAQIASTLVAQAGFPPLYLAPIDFVGLYRQQTQQQTQTAQKTESPAAPRVPTNNKWANLRESESSESSSSIIN